MALLINEVKAKTCKLLEVFVAAEAGKIKVTARVRSLNRTHSYRTTHRLHSLWSIVEAGISSGERIIDMISAGFHFQRLLEKLNRFGSIAFVELKHTLIVKSIRIARHRGRTRKSLFANCEIRAHSSHNLRLFAELREQAHKRGLCGREVLTIKQS